jgi:hypothetical protein
VRSLAIASFITAISTPVFAQITVQQPVIGTFGGNFSVIVPDRGATLLGSVGSAGESRSSYGLPFLRGSSIGRFTNHQSMWAHARIIDLNEMDRMVLEAADSGSYSGLTHQGAGLRQGIAYTELPSYRSPAIRENNRYSRSAIATIADALRSRTPNYRPSRSSQSVSTASRRPTATTNRVASTPKRSRALDPVRNYQLGLDAERAGKSGLAKLHFLTAAQNGSALARQKLEQSSQQTVAAQ